MRENEIAGEKDMTDSNKTKEQPNNQPEEKKAAGRSNSTASHKSSKHPRNKNTRQSSRQTQEKKDEKVSNVEKGLQDIVEPNQSQLIQKIDANTITIEGDTYEIVKNYRDAFDTERLEERYSEILSKYDYIVADWGYEQLRLKGFYDNRNKKVPVDSRIGSLEDYLYEYCNFGCPYFVLKRLEQKKGRKKSRRSSKRKQKNKNLTNQKKESPQRKQDEQTTASNQTKRKPSRTERSKTKKDFVKKEVKPAAENKPETKETVKVETVKDEKGKRQFSIRRKEIKDTKNNS